MLNLANIYRMRQIITCFFLFLLFALNANAQTCDCAKDIAFILDRYEQDYSGMPDFKQKNTNYTAKAKAFINASKQIQTVSSCDSLIGKIIQYLNNKHVFYGKTAKNPFYNETEEASDQINPYPSFQHLNKDAVYVKVPSCDLKFKDSLQWILKQHDSVIRHSKHMIIDVRGNGGGGDAVLNLLLPYLYTKPIISPLAALRASSNNIKMFEDLLSNEYIPESDKSIIRGIIEKAKANPNQFVLLSDKVADTIVFTQTLSNPVYVSILTDNKCMSATENFLLKAKQSSKVKVFGNAATAGGLDYGDLNFVISPSSFWYFSVPTTRSTRLPAAPIDNIGIKPDVKVSNNTDIINYILKYYQLTNKTK